MSDARAEHDAAMEDFEKAIERETCLHLTVNEIGGGLFECADCGQQRMGEF